MGAKIVRSGDFDILFAHFYHDKIFEIYEREERIKVLFIKEPGIYIGKDFSFYSEDVILSFKEKFPEEKFFYIFEINGIPFIYCDENSDVEKAKKFMKEIKIEYMINVEDNSLYFSGLLFNNKFVNILRKKLNVEVLKLHEV